jgi:2-dehydropantoate 2-reductase
MARILVIGAGGIGIVVLYALSLHADVAAVCRSNFQEAKENGFTVISRQFGGTVKFKVPVYASSAEAGSNWDYVLVCTKSLLGVPPSMAEVIKPAVGAETAIALIQNGVGIEDEYDTAFPNNPLLSCVIYLPTTQTAPGVVSSDGFDALEIGIHPPSALAQHRDKGERLAELIRKAGVSSTVHDNIQGRRWSKLIINASWNPICALTRSDDVNFMKSSPDAADLSWRAMSEVVTVARVLGYELDAAPQFARAKGRTVGIQPSMQADVLNNRRMEVEAILGNPVRIAKQLGIETPVLDTLYILSKALDDGIGRRQKAS